jgi:Papain-like cysteine protease AvrRpt2
MYRLHSLRLFCCLCLLCGFRVVALSMVQAGESAAAAQDKPPERWTLPVPMHPQETDLWCWAATSQMTMGYFGKQISQSQLANVVFHRNDCEQRPTPLPCIKRGDILIEPFGFKYDKATQPISPESIVFQIHGLRRPIPFVWKFPGGGGHAAMLVGYARDADGTFLVECLDPFPPPGRSPLAREGGQRLFIPHSRWCGDYDHTFSHAYFNVTPKQ